MYKLHKEASTDELQAGLATLHAQQKREQAEKLKKDADAIEANIKHVAEKHETGYWECEDGHESYTNLAVEGATICIQCRKPSKHMKRSEMTAQEQYKADKGRKEAEKIIENHRAQAEACAKEIADNEKAAQVFPQQANRSRAIAEDIRKV